MRNFKNNWMRLGRKRKGYLYVAVLFTSLAVSTMGLVALSIASLRLRTTIDDADVIIAETIAESAIEFGVAQIQTHDDWRTRFSQGVLSSEVACGRGVFQWKLVDDDGNLNDDDSDSVRVIGVGRIGRAVVAESVRLMPNGQPLTCLGSALHCGGDMLLKSAVQFMTNQQVSSGGNVTASGLLTSIQGNVECVGTASGTIKGTISPAAAARRLPGSSVFDYYVDNGTEIDVTSLPLVNGYRTIQKQVLSPTNNSYGIKNVEGIYVLRCAGQPVNIKDCRIVGTVVLLDPAATSVIEGTIRWDTAVQNYPALLVRGDVQIKTSNVELSEANQTTNFNPSTAPFEGKSDTDTSDSYASEINGLVYVSGLLNAPQDMIESPFRGVTLCTSINASSSCRFNYRHIFFDKPPPGFASGNPMLISPGSRTKVTMN